jgi:hypothetical protein
LCTCFGKENLDDFFSLAIDLEVKHNAHI